MPMVSEQLETRISAPLGVFRALVLERRSGACALMIRALEAAGAMVEVVRTGEEVGSAWVGQEVFVVEAGARDESLRQLVKWARQAGGEPYVVAVGDGMHDPGWLTAGRHGAQASMLEPDAGAAAMIVAEAREWLEVKKVAVEPMAAVMDTKTAPVAGKLASCRCRPGCRCCWIARRWPWRFLTRRCGTVWPTGVGASCSACLIATSRGGRISRSCRLPVRDGARFSTGHSAARRWCGTRTR